MPIVTTNGLRPDSRVSPTVYNIQWAEATGSPETIEAFYDPPVASLYDGLILGFRATGGNTTATPTFAPDNLAPHTIVKNGGTPLQANDIPDVNAEVLVRYNASLTRWELLNPRNPSLFVPPVEYYRAITDSLTGSNTADAQPWFPTNGSVALEPGGYWIEGLLATVRSAGTTSHTTGLLYGGTATVTRIQTMIVAASGNDTATLASLFGLRGAQTTEDTFKAASTSASEQAAVYVRGSLVIESAGTFTPQFKYSTAPGGAPTIRQGTFFRLVRYSDDPTVQEQGAWS